MKVRSGARVGTSRGAATAARGTLFLIVAASVLAMSGCLGNQDNPPPKNVFDVLIGVTPASLTVPAGGNTTATVQMSVNGDNTCGIVQLSAAAAGGGSLPNWLHVTFNPSQLIELQQTTSTMSAAVDPSTPADTVDVLVVGTCKDFSAPTAQVHETLTVPEQGPAPTITSISPSTIIAGNGSFTLTVNGTNFISSSQVEWNGGPLTTTFVSATQVTAQVPGSDIANPGAATVTVVGPGTSNAVTLTISAQSTLGIVTVISESANLNEGLANSVPNPIIALSANGRYAAFENEGATNLTSPPLVSQNFDIYFHDSCVGVSDCTRQVQLASVINGFSGNGGNDGNGPSIDEPARNGVSISGDGRFIVFLSHATNLAAPQANFEEAYIRDTCTGAAPGCEPSTHMISLTDGGAEPNSAAFDAAISADGGHLAFVSAGTNLVENPAPPGQAYVRSTSPGCAPTRCTMLVSIDNNGVPFASGANEVAVSASGRFVIFDAIANNGGVTQETFVHDTCLNPPPGSNCQPSTTMVSVDSNGNAAPRIAYAASISDDGRIVEFLSADQLAPNSLAGQQNVYLRDTCQTDFGPVPNCTPTTVTASVASDGSTANAGTLDHPIGNPHRLSGNGRFVVFASQATNLVPGGNSAGGVFVRDTCLNGPDGCTPTTVLVSVDQNGGFVPGLYPVISADGHYCAFMVGFPSNEPEEQAVLALTSF